MDTAVALIIPAVIGLVTGAVATAYKSRKDLEVQYDIKLREERIGAYKLLWKELDRLAYYAPEQPLTYGVANELATALRAWYFSVGGLLMSARTREPYFDLQRALKSVGDAHAGRDTELPRATGDALKQLGSRLRTSTTDDVATRVGPHLRHSLRAWPMRGLRAKPLVRLRAKPLVRLLAKPLVRLLAKPLVTVTRGWRFRPDAAGVWRVGVVNRSRSRALTVRKVWLDASPETNATPLDWANPLPRTLYPGEAWQGFVPDQAGLMDGVGDPFRTGWASGPGWRARSRSGGDPPASPIPRDTERVARAHGVQIVFQRVGEGPPLVFVHGAAEDGRVWRPQLAALADEFTVVAWDEPGAGRSSDLPAAFGMADYAKCLAVVVEALALGPAHVAGLSWGGIVVQELYRQRPDLVATLILVDTYAGWKGSLSGEEVRARVEEVRRRLDTPADEFDPTLPGLFAGGPPAEFVPLLEAMAADLRPESMRTALRVMAEADQRDLLPGIDVPTLLIWGEFDERSPPSVRRQFKEAIPNAQLVMIRRAGHMSNLEQPDQFNDAVREFCRNHPPHPA
ncbi:MAG: alpha/beta fold hydrolase [Solirubrobacteraceae bacterium]